MNYELALQFSETPWAILPSTLEAMTTAIAVGVDWAGVGGIARPSEPRGRSVGNIAIIQIDGVITPKSSFMSAFFGGAPLDQVQASLRQAMADNSIGGIILAIDSPGGSVAGVQEMADEIYTARSVKPILAVNSGMAASAAYWLASSASEIMASPSSEVGSVGVYAVHQRIAKMADRMGIETTYISRGKYKIESNPFDELTDEARAAMQERVDEYYNAFTTDIARGRGVAVTDVQNGYGEGRVLGAKKAKQLGMIDAIGTMDAAIARMNRMMKQSGARADAEPIDMRAVLPTPEDEQAIADHEQLLAELDFRRRRLKLAGR